ncbi:MAG: hypothetical protein J1F18_08960 [Lachnospiraceae bacterium]|nr:hypothetical protein [Lachnospiraceae bacterium]
MIVEVIDKIPQLLEYFIPGYVAVWLYKRWKSAFNENDLSDIHVGAIVFVSYIIRLSLKTVYHGLLLCIPSLSRFNTVDVRCLVEILVACIIAFVLIKARRITWIRTLYSKVNRTTLSSNVFECCNLDLKPQVTVYLDKKRIEGRLLLYDLTPDAQWITIDKHFVYDEDNALIDAWYNHDYERYLIRLEDVHTLVVHYDGSDKIVPPKYKAKQDEALAALIEEDT